MICAPSNAAIDEIVKKIIEKGLLNEKGEKVSPFLVRVGPNFNETLEEYSFDNIIARET